MIDLSDARPLRQSEVTPALEAASERVLHSSLPLGGVELVADDVAARVEIHTNGTSTNPAPHPHRGVTLYHLGPHAAVPGPATGVVEGIDLSSYQPGADLAAVAASGRAFVYAKATEGLTLTDGAFAEHWSRARDAGLLRGAYHFLRASRSSVDQVARFLDVVGAVEDAYGRAELPPCLDVEVDDGVDVAGVAAAVARAVEAMAAAGRRPVVYTTPNFWASLTIGALDADLWVAHWGVNSPTIPHGWDRATLWQYSATATVPGVAGRMDVDRYIGCLTSLRAWGAGQG